MSPMILHRAMGSPAARSVMMLADILHLELQIKEVNIVKFENRTPEFVKLNPMKTVPVIQDGDYVLSESHAIMKYLLEKYGESHKERLYPSEPRARGVVDQCMFFNAGVFFKALLNCSVETLMGKLTEPSKKHVAEIEASYEVIEAYLASRPYIAADRLTLADIANGSTVTAIRHIHKVDKDKFPKCTDWVSRLEEETFFKTVNKEGSDYFGKLLNAFWKRNKQANSS